MEMSSCRIPALVKKLGTGGWWWRQPSMCLSLVACGMLWMQNDAKKVIFADKKGINMNVKQIGRAHV